MPRKKKKVEEEQKEIVKEKITASFFEGKIITESSDAAMELYNQSRYGTPLKENKIQLSLLEGLYLMEKGRLDVFDGRRHKLDFNEFARKAKKLEPNFVIRYAVFNDFRNRGYIIKTALKFGADFRVYDRGVKPGEDHAKWVVYPVHEGSTLTWYEFSSKNRVAHSTKKRLLIGCVDDEGDVTYWEIRWVRP
ncbi:tRNA-intron lyase [Candidatus Woesearchaeota archaeon]|nr:tRNA-intron lyase [Candidatus Woesearchaeota archaeon]